VKSGTWIIVLMNANAAAPVSATVSVGANTNLVLWVGIACAVFGLILAGAGTALLLAGSGPRPSRRSRAAADKGSSPASGIMAHRCSARRRSDRVITGAGGGCSSQPGCSSR
jgi:hypothetical protein